jgi:hypothetical protein
LLVEGVRGRGSPQPSRAGGGAGLGQMETALASIRWRDGRQSYGAFGFGVGHWPHRARKVVGRSGSDGVNRPTPQAPLGAGSHAGLGCSSLKCGLQKSARRIFGWGAAVLSSAGADRPSEAGVEVFFDERPRIMQRERVRDILAKRSDLAGHAGPRRSSRIPGTTEGASGRLQHYSLTRMVPARSWLEGSSDDDSPLALARVERLRQLASGLDPYRWCPSSDTRRQRFE